MKNTELKINNVKESKSLTTSSFLILCFRFFIQIIKMKNTELKMNNVKVIVLRHFFIFDSMF